MTTANFPSEERDWANTLYSGGLLAFAVACNFSISLSQISLSLALIGAIFLHRNGKLILREVPFKEPFMFFAFAGVFSVFQADDKIRAITELKKFLVIFVFYLAYWPAMKDEFQKKLFTAFVTTATITAILSMKDVLMGAVLNDRARGFFSTSITFGECQAIASITIIIWLLIGNNCRKHVIALFSSLFLISASMISTMSRGPWLGFLAGIFVLTIKFPRKMLPVILIIGLLAIPVVLSTPSLRTRIESFSISKNIEGLKKSLDGNFESAALASNFERLNIWHRGFMISEPHSSFGVGMNNVKKKYYDLATEYERQNNHLIYGHQHNNFMQVLLMTGLIGLTAFFIFLVAIFKFFFKCAEFNDKSWNKSISVGAAAVFLCFMVTGLTEYSWGDEEVTMMAFFITGLMMNRASQQLSTMKSTKS